VLALVADAVVCAVFDAEPDEEPELAAGAT